MIPRQQGEHLGSSRGSHDELNTQFGRPTQLTDSQATESSLSQKSANNQDFPRLAKKSALYYQSSEPTQTSVSSENSMNKEFRLYKLSQNVERSLAPQYHPKYMPIRPSANDEQIRTTATQVDSIDQDKDYDPLNFFGSKNFDSKKGFDFEREFGEDDDLRENERQNFEDATVTRKSLPDNREDKDNKDNKEGENRRKQPDNKHDKTRSFLQDSKENFGFQDDFSTRQEDNPHNPRSLWNFGEYSNPFSNNENRGQNQIAENRGPKKEDSKKHGSDTIKEAYEISSSKSADKKYRKQDIGEAKWSASNSRSHSESDEQVDNLLDFWVENTDQQGIELQKDPVKVINPENVSHIKRSSNFNLEDEIYKLQTVGYRRSQDKRPGNRHIADKSLIKPAMVDFRRKPRQNVKNRKAPDGGAGNRNISNFAKMLKQDNSAKDRHVDFHNSRVPQPNPVSYKINKIVSGKSKTPEVQEHSKSKKGFSSEKKRKESDSHVPSSQPVEMEFRKRLKKLSPAKPLNGRDKIQLELEVIKNMVNTGRTQADEFLTQLEEKYIESERVSSEASGEPVVEERQEKAEDDILLLRTSKKKKKLGLGKQKPDYETYISDVKGSNEGSNHEDSRFYMFDDGYDMILSLYRKQYDYIDIFEVDRRRKEFSAVDAHNRNMLMSFDEIEYPKQKFIHVGNKHQARVPKLKNESTHQKALCKLWDPDKTTEDMFSNFVARLSKLVHIGREHIRDEKAGEILSEWNYDADKALRFVSRNKKHVADRLLILKGKTAEEEEAELGIVANEESEEDIPDIKIRENYY